MGGGFDPLVVPTLIDRQKRKVVVDSKVFRREQKTKSSPCFFWGGPFFSKKEMACVFQALWCSRDIQYSLVFRGKRGGFNGISGDLKDLPRSRRPGLIPKMIFNFSILTYAYPYTYAHTRH